MLNSTCRVYSMPFQDGPGPLYGEQHSKEKRCSARGCKRMFFPRKKDQKYCSDRCRWRESKRKQMLERTEDGKCPQCGGKWIEPLAIQTNKPSYCKNCQVGFHQYYTKYVD